MEAIDIAHFIFHNYKKSQLGHCGKYKKSKTLQKLSTKRNRE